MRNEQELPNTLCGEGLARLAEVLLEEDQPCSAANARAQLHDRLGAYGPQPGILDGAVSRYFQSRQL